MTRAPVDDLLPLGMKAVEEESGGAVAPEIGSLYRVLARLAAQDLVEEAPAPVGGDAIHPGRERRYYGLTERGRQAAQAEAARLRDAVRLAHRRDLLPGASGASGAPGLPGPGRP